MKPFIFKSPLYKDARGFFTELWLKKKIKFPCKFTAISSSKKNVIRGLHLQKQRSQGKFITVLKGKIFDVAVDLRKNSKTFGKHFKIILSEKNCRSIYIPPGFAHGFCTLAKENYVIYGCTNYRDKNSESGINYDDIDINIKWPIKKPILSSKDKKNMSLKEFLKNN